jgi:cystathionine beta-synthase
MNELRVFDRFSDAVGWTPLVRIDRATEGLGCAAYAKIELMNPMGSVKDRIARFMILRALESGELRPGGKVVEASSGNTALGIAMMARQYGLSATMIMKDKTSREKIDCLRALGVEILLVDGNLPPEHPQSYQRKVRQVLAENPGVYFPDQHNNRANNEAHYRTTGPEIWRQMDGRIDYFVAAIGTGGTVSGVARYLKEQDPSIQVVAVDVEGSVFTEYFKTGRHGPPGPYLLEGMGDEEVIGCPEFELYDDMLQVSDRDAFHMARRLAASEGIFCGGSSGAALWGIHQVAKRAEEGARMVTVFPDSGTRYLSTLYNDEWMREKGMLDGS